MQTVFITLIYFCSVQYTLLPLCSCTPSFFPPELHLLSRFLISKKSLSYLITFSSGQLSSCSQSSFWDFVKYISDPLFLLMTGSCTTTGGSRFLSCLPLTPSGYNCICSVSLFSDCCCFYEMKLGSC